jgi:hypothetical protein
VFIGIASSLPMLLIAACNVAVAADKAGHG